MAELSGIPLQLQDNMTSQMQILRAPGFVGFITWNIRGMGNATLTMQTSMVQTGMTHNFFTKLIASLPDVNTHQLIISGDLNCALNPQLDRWNPKPDSQLSKAGSVVNFSCSPMVLQIHGGN